ncbi:hypothetical protein E8E11_001480 [Didymella keratinophila]|nr:hypothetical protein E8E11_001480 [Didymella keratinophila]
MSGAGSWGYGTLLQTFLWGYLIGGLTLLPAVAVFAWYWTTTQTDAKPLEEPPIHLADQTKPRKPIGSTKESKDDELKSLGAGLDEQILESLKGRTHEADVFAGYFAVCREYVPGGVNGKPPERTTPAGAVVAMESPSIYQSMYSNIFNRNKTMSPSLDAPNTKTKKARNVFYVVLRLGHLMLYDNEDQLDVRHVISLARYEVDIYGGGERLPEGELWIKRNCVRLNQKLENDPDAEAKSFYLFSDNCSEKEDFYHAMLQAQDHHQDHGNRQPPVPLKFDTPDLVKLVQQLHANEENLHTRWINALIGRVFLALYKTPEIKNFIATKITKKIARVPKPALISSVQLRKIDMGTLPPFVTNPKLKELTVDGDLVVEADVSYKGNFRIEIEATARIDLGQRFKAREVTLVLGCYLKRLDGHLLLRIKPPPSNRLWMTFETPPRMELSVEPIVSTRQITYGPILRAIESRIKEVLNETLVLPNWDDMPFMDTIAQTIRGGIWESAAKGKDELEVNTDDIVGLDTASVEVEKLDTESIHSHLSVPSSMESEEIGLGVTSATDWRSLPMKARSLRSAPSIKVGSKNASTETLESSSKSTPQITPLASPLRSKTSEFAFISPDKSTEDVSVPTLWSESSHSVPNLSETNHSRSKSKEDLTPEQIAAATAAAHSAQTSATKKQTINQSFNAAAGAARNWLAAKQTQGQAHRKKGSVDTTNLPIGVHIRNGQFYDGEAPVEAPSSPQPPSKSHTEPMGRGQPLPPPGTPLPPPPGKQKTWGVPIQAASALANLAKRKPVSGGPATSTSAKDKKDPERPGTSQSSSNSSLHQLQQHDNHESHTASANTQDRSMPRRKSSSASTASQHPPPLPKRRQRQSSASQHSNSSIRHSAYHDGAGEEVFVVEAPLAEVSAPPSPAVGVSRQLGDGKTGEERMGRVSRGSSIRSTKAEDEAGHGTFPFA